MNTKANQMSVKLNRVDFDEARFCYKDSENGFNMVSGAIFAAKFCKSCHAELYGEWYFPSYDFVFVKDKEKTIRDNEKRIQSANNDLRLIYNDIVRVISMDRCPVCGEVLEGELKKVILSKTCQSSFSKVVSGDLFYSKCKWWLRDSYGHLDKYEEMFRREREDRVNKSNTTEKVIKIIEQKCNEFDVLVPDYDFSGFSADNTTALKKYILQLCNTEKNIFSLKERLKALYTEYIESSNRILIDEFRSKKENSDALNRIDNEINNLTEQINNYHPEPDFAFSNFVDHRMQKPEKPVMPLEPDLKVAGMFNKKKIAEENALILRIYEQKMQIYRAECEAYRMALEKYESNLKAKYEEAVAMHKVNAEKNLQQLKGRMDQLLCDRERIAANLCVAVTPEKEVARLLETEIREAEELLRKFYEHRNQLYAYNVVYVKYRDFVAVSSFYDYLASGRCTNLEGSDGAYNLYEQECRTNMIISQLSRVIESLEQAKRNQFMLYQQLGSINLSLDGLNNKMNQAVTSLRTIADTTNDIASTTKDIASTTKDIADTTTVIAYNTERTAYYSKLNAELTNSLGYMMALR